MSKPTYSIALALAYRDRRWLVAQRPPQVHLGGLWEFPGGKIEPGELPTQAALRELREECGICASAERTLVPLNCDYGDRIVHLTPVICRWEAGDAQALASQECRWVSADELRALDMPAINATIVQAITARDSSTA